MIIKRCSVLLSPLLLAACVPAGPTVGVGGFPIVSEREAQAIIDSLTAVTDEQKKEIDKSFLIATAHEEYRVEKWVQPINKTEECKIVFSASHGEDIDWFLYSKNDGPFWDGRCENGYAIGLGRVFARIKEDNSLASFLLEYPANGGYPTTYMRVNYDNNQIMWEAKNDSYLSQLYMNQINTDPLTKEIRNTSFIHERNTGNRYINDTLIGSDTVKFIKMLPNDQQWILFNNYNPIQHSVSESTGPVDSNHNNVGILLVKDLIGGHIAYDYRNTPTYSRVIPPNNYVNYLISVNQNIIDANQKMTALLQSSFSAVSRYQNRICRGNVSVKWMSDEIYGRICLPDGELSVFSDLMAARQQEQKERLELAQQKFAEQQQQRVEQERKNQLFALERQRLEQERAAANRAANRAAVSATMQSISQSLEQFNQGAANTLRQASTPIHIPQVNFGIQNSTNTVNCIRTLGNTVHCR